MRLYKYRVDGRQDIYPRSIYANNVDGSLKKWIDYVFEPEIPGQDKTELRSFLNHGKVSGIKRLGDCKDIYYLMLTMESGRLTVYIDEIDITPDFIADLEYLPTEKGGRKEYAASGYRPHVRFPFSENMTSGEQIFWDRDKVFPGERARAQIRILDHDTFENALDIGIKFQICEGANVVGTGVIVEVRNERLKKSNR
jgi:hypothetical protein